MASPFLRRPTWPLSLTAATVGAVLLIGNALESFHYCGGENTYCAYGGPLKRWEGRVFTSDGRPADRAGLAFQFQSTQPRAGATIRPVKVVTDPIGRFCFRWPRERIAANLNVALVRSGAAPDPRFSALPPGAFLTEAPGNPILVSPDAGVDIRAAGSLRLSRTLFDPQFDTTATCPEAAEQPPWYRADNLSSNWRYRLIEYLALAGLLIGAGSLILPSHLRRRIAAVGVSIGALDVVLFTLIWITKTV